MKSHGAKTNYQLTGEKKKKPAYRYTGEDSKHGEMLLIREHKGRLHGCSLFYFYNSSIAV